MYNRIRFYIGVGKDRNGITIEDFDRWEKLRKVNLRLAKEFGGYTSNHSKGGWINPQGELVQEPSVVYEVLTTVVVGPVFQDSLAATVHYIGWLFNQESILVTTEVVGGQEFIIPQILGYQRFSEVSTPVGDLNT